MSASSDREAVALRVASPTSPSGQSEPVSAISGSIDSLSLSAVNDPDREKWQRVMRFTLWFLFVLSTTALPANMVMIQPEQRSDSRCQWWALLGLQYPAHCLLMFSRCRAIANFWSRRASRTILVVTALSAVLFAFGSPSTKVDDEAACFVHPLVSLGGTIVLFLWIYLCYRFLQLLRTRRTVLVIMIAATGTSSAVLFVVGLLVIVGSISSDPARLSIIIVTIDAAMTSVMTLYMLYRIYARQPLLRWLSRRGIKSRGGGRAENYRVGRQVKRRRLSQEQKQRMSSTPLQQQQHKKDEAMVAVGLTVAHKIEPQ
eukprot:TRINITY_DN65903_c0_g1_i1.p1 TRINITY_DN65903_c0_g1~~TRINITY_DN65903_c0_g1_i1.p1  ORF type:complete len:315 (+),score=97.47 TRINITY_DN65903_c0_g1_i1:62-1006(+)